MSGPDPGESTILGRLLVGMMVFGLVLLAVFLAFTRIVTA